jgi:hypothetical protein
VGAKSGAGGVINSNDGLIYDTASNQINGAGSTFYDADMRGIEQPYTDALTEFIAPLSGMGAVPYLDPAVPFYDRGTIGGPEATNRLNFELLWGLHSTAPNYIYLLGCRGRSYTGGDMTAGITDSGNHYSYIYVESVTTWGLAQLPPFTTDQTKMALRFNTEHEFGHDFRLNCCSDLTCGSKPNLGQHDARPWWNYTTTGCPNANPCLEMYDIPNPPTGIDRFCKEDLLLGDPNCGASAIRDSAVRNQTDPLP